MYSVTCGATRALLINLSTLVNVAEAHTLSGEDRTTLRDERRRMGRYVMLALECAMLRARGASDSAEGRIHLQREGLLLSDGEWDAMVYGERHTSVYCWLQRRAVICAQRGWLTELALQTCCERIGAARDASNDLMASLWLDLPYPYASLVSMIIKVAILMQTLLTGMQTATYTDLGARVYGYVQLFLYAMLFQSLINLHTKLHNPFLAARLAIAHEATARDSLQRLADTLMSDITYEPPPPPAVKEPPKRTATQVQVRRGSAFSAGSAKGELGTPATSLFAAKNLPRQGATGGSNKPAAV